MLNAIIWDYDGTLVDTRRKNMEVTKEIMREVTEGSLDQYSVLQSLEEYQAANERAENWRALYKTCFELSDSQIDRAGSMWKEYQMKNETEVTLFKNIRNVLNEFRDYKHGIFSQNAYKNILSYLTEQQLDSYFLKVIGYEEISYDQQKPNPAGLLKCITHLTNSDSGSVVYIGDHETDTQCACLADEELKKSGSTLEIFSVAALYGSATGTSIWKYKPDFEAHNPRDLSAIINKLVA